MASGSAVFSLPLLTLGAPYMEYGGEAPMDLLVLSLSGEGASGAAGTVVQSLPLPDSNGEGISGAVRTMELTLPLPEILTAEGISGSTGRLQETLEIRLLASGVDGETGQADLALPVLEGSSLDQGGALAADLPGLNLSAQGVTEALGRAESSLPHLRLSAAGLQDHIPITGGDSQADLNLPALKLAASGLSEGQGIGLMRLSLLTVSAQGSAGQAGQGQATFPVLTLAAAGGSAEEGTAAIILPPLSLSAEGELAVYEALSAGLAEINVYSMNLKNSGVGSFSHYPFNSYGLFKGVYLGAAAGGIYRLSGATDLTAPEDDRPIRAELAKEALGNEIPQKKNLTKVLADLEAEGPFDLSVSVNEVETAYPGIPYRSGLRIQSVKVGRGLTGRDFKIGLKSRGGNMTVREVMVPLEISGQRIAR